MMSSRNRRAERRRIRTAVTGGFRPAEAYPGNNSAMKSSRSSARSGSLRNEAFVIPKRVVGGRISPDMAMFNHLELERELLKKQGVGANDEYEEKAPRVNDRTSLANKQQHSAASAAAAAARNQQMQAQQQAMAAMAARERERDRAAAAAAASARARGQPSMASSAAVGGATGAAQMPGGLRGGGGVGVGAPRMPGPVGRREPVEDIKDAARHVSLVPVRFRGGGREPPADMQPVRQAMPPQAPPRAPVGHADPRMAAYAARAQYQRQQHRQQGAPPGGASARDYHSRISSADYQRLLRASLANYYQQQQQYPGHQYHRNVSQSLAYRLGKQTAVRHAPGTYDENAWMARAQMQSASYGGAPMGEPPRRGRYGADGMWYPDYDSYGSHGSPYQRRHPRQGAQLMYDEPPPVASYGSGSDKPLRKQIEYYFSDDNLANDDYLQGLMDPEGFVKARFLELFPRIQKMKASATQILDACSSSRVLEVLNRKIRRRADWEKFLPDPENVSRRILEAMATKIEDRWIKMQKFRRQLGVGGQEDQKEEDQKEEEEAAVAGAAVQPPDEESKEAPAQQVEDKKVEPQDEVQVNGDVAQGAGGGGGGAVEAEEDEEEEVPNDEDSDDGDDDDGTMVDID